jgi:hypothetical protein
MTHDEMIAVIQAAKDGAAIECARMSAYYAGKRNGPWTKIKQNPIVFNFQNYTYRVAPEVREFTVVLDANGTPIGIGPGRPGSYIMINPTTDMAGVTTMRVREVLSGESS